MHKHMLKGFIGPLGDDIPSLLIVMLALSLFFAALSYTFDSYDMKVRNFQKLKGAMDIARVVTADGLITRTLSDISLDAKPIAKSYSLNYSIEYTDGSERSGVDCSTVNWLVFDYPIAKYDSSTNNILLKTLRVCVG